jgi:uncharacterized protein with HEPN domain
MSKAKDRVQKIILAIEDIEYILNEIKITKALEDRVIKPALRMHLVRIAEQFNKLKDENEFEILERFKKEDLRGISAVRNYIAHDYDSVDDEIIEMVLRYNLKDIKSVAEGILDEE